MLRALRDPWLAASLAGLGALFALVAAFGTDAGVTWDEGFQLEYGQRILAWFRSGFSDPGALEYLDLYLYGGLFDALAQLIVERSALGPFETKHLLSALVAVAGIVASWRLAAAVGGSRAGFFGALTLALTPAFIGHGLFNPKDIPFATAAAFATLTAQRLVLGPLPFRLRDVLWAGVALGAALAVRPGGIFLLSYPLAAAAARVGLELARHSPGERAPIVSLAARTLPQLLLGLVVAWAVMLSAWPWAQLAPLSRPFEAIWAASHFDWSGELLFEGRRIAAAEVPARYLFVWFAITLPELYLIAFAAGIAAFLGRRREAGQTQRRLAGGVIALAVGLPLMAAVIARPVLYDAHRHFLFLLPPMAALAGLGMSALLGSAFPRGVRSAVILLWAAAALRVAVAIVQLHPYEYVFFNASVGGLRGAAGRYETDYWGASYREGLAWVVDHVRPHGAPVRLAACDGSSAARMFYYLQRWPNAAGRFTVASSPAQAELFLAVTRLECDRAINGRVLHVVERQGVPLLIVKQVTR